MPLVFRSAFFLALFLLLTVPFFFPAFHPLFFAPALVIAIYRGSLLSALWKALFCGIVLDLFSSSLLFGVSSLNYALTVALLYSQKRNFFEDNLSTLPLMTFAFSVVSTILQYILGLFFGSSITLSWAYVFTDLIAMPLLDSLMAFALFSLPFYLYKNSRKVREQ